MQKTNQRPTFSDILNWFDPRNKQPGSWAFILNRLTAIGLTVYLYLHLVILANLARGPEAYDNFIAIVKQPLFVFGELLVVIAGLYHGLNGIRIILNSFGIAVPQQRALFYGMFLITVIGGVIFAIRMFTA